MDKILVGYKKSYLLIPISILVGLILIFIDSKISHKELTKKDYIKFSLIIGVITTFILYIHNIKGRIEEEVLSGPVPF